MAYKYVGEDDHSFRVQHPDGSEFTIVKSAVGPGVHERIKGLEPIKMKDGGFVPGLEDEKNASEMPSDPLQAQDFPSEKAAVPAQNPMDMLSQFQEYARFSNVNATPEQQERIAQDLTLKSKEAEAAGQLAAQKRAEQQQALTAAQDADYNARAAKFGLPLRDVASSAYQPILPQQPVVAPAVPAQQVQAAAIDPTAKAYADAFAQQESGIRQQSQAQSNAAIESAKILEQQAKQAEDFVRISKENRANFEKENSQLIDAITNFKINPDRLYQNMNTGNKILAGISLFLGGAGAGLTGGENGAFQVLQKAVDRDIDAQKAELGKKQNLLSENYRRFGTMQSALDATQLQMNAVNQAKLGAIAAKSRSQEEQARAKQLMGALQMQAAQLTDRLAQANAVKAIAGGAQATDAQIQSLPKEVRERAVKLGNKYALAIDDASAKDARKLVGASDALMKNVDQIIELRNKYGSETIPGEVKAKMQALASKAQLAYKGPEFANLGAISETDKQFLDNVLKDPTAFDFTMSRYSTFRKALRDEISSKLNAYGIKAGDFGAEKPTERIDPTTGKTALFDPETKKFLGYKS